MTSRLWLAGLLLALFAIRPALAGPQFVVAIHGYDPVAYFTDGKAVLGELGYTHFWNGANWLFSSEASRAKFATDPAAFAPQFDGYCAYAASRGYIAPGDPRVWRLVDGRLYLNYSDEAKKLWEQDVPGNIAAANENWPRLNAY